MNNFQEHEENIHLKLSALIKHYTGIIYSQNFFFSLNALVGRASTFVKCFREHSKVTFPITFEEKYNEMLPQHLIELNITTLLHGKLSQTFL